MVPEILGTTDRIFVILDHFVPFDPPNNQKNQNLEKIKKTHGDIIILNLCTTYDDHMMYGSWYKERDSRMLCNFGPVFALLPH